MNALKCLLAAAACLSVIGCGSPPKQAAHVEQQVLLKSHSSWDGAPYKTYPAGPPELTLLRIRIPANTQMPWHSHPIPNAAYVVSGELTVETRRGGLARTLKPGETLAEMVGTVHRGTTGKTPVELLVFYAGTPDMPLSQPY
ncbi:cupin domain-containing protein [Pseudomonas spelaei]